MSYVVLVLAVLGVYPLALLGRRIWWIPVGLSALLGLLPFLGIDILTLDFFQQPYRGDTRSLEIAAVDLCAATLFFALPPARQPAPFRASRWSYFLVALCSLAMASVPLYTLFSLAKILRAFFLFTVVVRLAEQPRLTNALGRGLALGVIYSAISALVQRYVGHSFQVTGGFEHPNSLGMAVNLVAPIALAVLMAGKGDWLGVATVVAAGICLVLALSRGALILFGVATAIVFLGSMVRRFSRRKLVVTVSFALGAVLVLGKSSDTIVERFETAPAASVQARERFDAAAEAMIREHPLGIGLNQFSHVLENGGYSERFGMPPMDRDALAHHIYLLTGAELGWLGLLAYVWLIAMPWWVSVRGALRFRGDVRGDILLGCAAGMTVMHLHGFAEWIARQTPMMYLFWTIAGLAVATDRSAAARDPEARRARSFG